MFTGGVLTITRDAPAVDYQAILRSVTYINSSQNPTATARNITFVVNDGLANSTTRTSTITIIPVNDPPDLDLNGPVAGNDSTASFTEDGGPVFIMDSSGTVTDIDNTTLPSATITITNLLDGSHEALAAVTTGTAITASYNPSTGVLSLTGTDTVAHYQQVLRSATYNNDSQNPTTIARTITVVVNDGAAPSPIRSSVVAVAAVNDVPVIDLNGAAGGADLTFRVFPDGSNVSVADPGATVVDVDNTTLVSATVTLASRPDGLQEGLTAIVGGTSIPLLLIPPREFSA